MTSSFNSRVSLLGAVRAAGLRRSSGRGAAAGNAETARHWELCGYVPVPGTRGLSLDAHNWFPLPDVWED